MLYNAINWLKVSREFENYHFHNYANLKGNEKKGKQLLSHRYNLLPLLCSQPGGVQRELVVKDLPGTKVVKAVVLQNIN